MRNNQFITGRVRSIHEFNIAMSWVDCSQKSHDLLEAKIVASKKEFVNEVMAIAMSKSSFVHKLFNPIIVVLRSFQGNISVVNQAIIVAFELISTPIPSSHRFQYCK